MNAELQAAVDRLYVAFSDVQKPGQIDGCPCCIEGKQVDVLLAKPLREITPDELSRYAASVFLTIGSKQDFLYFVPRILEILVVDLGWWPDPEVVARALKTAEFNQWPDHHKTPVLEYFDAVFSDLLAEEDTDWLIDSWMCAFGRLLPDIEPYLRRLAQHPEKVIEYYEYNSECLIKGRLCNSFWNDELPTYRQVMDWFILDEVEKIKADFYNREA